MLNFYSTLSNKQETAANGLTRDEINVLISKSWGSGYSSLFSADFNYNLFMYSTTKDVFKPKSDKYYEFIAINFGKSPRKSQKEIDEWLIFEKWNEMIELDPNLSEEVKIHILYVINAGYEKGRRSKTNARGESLGDHIMRTPGFTT